MAASAWGTHVHLRSTRIRTYTALYIFLRCLKPLNSLSVNRGPPHCCLDTDIKHENVSFSFKKMREDTDLPQKSTMMFLRKETERFIFFSGFLYCFYLHLISIYCAWLVLKFWQSDIVSELKYLTPAKKQNWMLLKLKIVKEFQINLQDFTFKPVHMTYCFSKKKASIMKVKA